jgi:hypothetical protein
MKKCIFCFLDAFHITLTTQLEHRSKITTYPDNKQMNLLPSFHSLHTIPYQTKPNQTKSDQTTSRTPHRTRSKPYPHDNHNASTSVHAFRTTELRGRITMRVADSVLQRLGWAIMVIGQKRAGLEGRVSGVC